MRRAGAGAPMDAGFSEVWMAEGDLLGRVILRDDIRPQSATVVEDCATKACAPWF